MPYTPTQWVDHIVDPVTQKIIQQGTPVSATKLNNMEQGISESYDASETSLARTHTLMTDALDMRMRYEFDGQARAYGLTTNMCWITFRDMNDINIIAGEYDAANKKVRLP